MAPVPSDAAPHAVPTLTQASQDQALYRCLIDSLTDYAVFAIALDGTVLSWNAGAEQIFGYTTAEMIGRSFAIIFTDRDRDSGAPQNELATALSGEQTQHDRWHVRKGGARFWGVNTVQPLRDDFGALVGFTKLVRDITANHLALEHLSDSEQQLRLLVESVRGYAIFSIGLDGVVTTWNTGAERVYGYTSSEIVGAHVAKLSLPEDVATGVPAAEMRDAALHGSTRSERWQLRKDGSRFWSRAGTSRLKPDAAGNLRGFVKVSHDITEEHAAQLDLRRRAHFDELTELPNRRTFYDNTRRAIGAMKRRSASLFAVLFIDLDHFKAINDELGHIVADGVLMLAARRLERCIRAEDTVARIGGDEFAILLNGINGIDDAREAADRIGIEFGTPLVVDGCHVRISASIGIAVGAPSYEQPEDILRDADAAMYCAKLNGRARAVVFEPAVRTGVRTDIDLVSELRTAIVNGELRLGYQPVLRLRDRAIVGYEALVRWQHPRLGLLMPAEFVALAEKSGLIAAVDRWVLATACRQYVMWRDRGAVDAGVQMSVNVSSLEFRSDDFLTDVRETLSAAGMPATALRLEITENTLMEPSERAAALVAAIRALGVSIDVDDFGTGYASLKLLQTLTVDALKIDASFVAGIAAGTGAALVTSIVTLARQLGLNCVAEGIETKAQLVHVAALGCECGQGFLFAPPLEEAAAVDYRATA